MKHRTILIFTTMLLMATCVGCGEQPRSENFSQVQQQTQQAQQEQNVNLPSDNVSNNSEYENPETGDGLFEICKLSGTVVEFSEIGCKITPTHYEDNLAYEAAPGHENQNDLITVTYSKDCTYQIANVNIQTGKVTYEAASINDLKKQTRLIICGDYDSDNVLYATRIFIYRSMR